MICTSLVFSNDKAVQNCNNVGRLMVDSGGVMGQVWRNSLFFYRLSTRVVVDTAFLGRVVLYPHLAGTYPKGTRQLSQEHKERDERALLASSGRRQQLMGFGPLVLLLPQ